MQVILIHQHPVGTHSVIEYLIRTDDAIFYDRKTQQI